MDPAAAGHRRYRRRPAGGDRSAHPPLRRRSPTSPPPAARLQAGWSGRDALVAFADEIDDAVCDQVVGALLLHLKDRGDTLGAVLSSIAAATAKEVSMRKETDAERASARFSIRFMTGFSLLAVLVAAFSGDYMDPYRSEVGQIVMLVLAVTFVGLLGWVRVMSRPAAVPRLLGRSAREVSQ